MVVDFSPPTMTTSDTDRLDEIFSVLSDSRRRYALYFLRSQSGPVDCRYLANEIARLEAAGDRDAATDETVERIELQLHHKHVPKLEAAGLLAVSSRGDSVALRDTAVLEPFLEEAARIDGLFRPVDSE